MPVVQRSELPLDEEVFHVGGQFERIAVRDDDVGDFAGFERADLVGEAENLRRIKGDGFQGFVVRQAVGNGVGGMLAQAAREGIVKAAEGKFDAGGSEFRGLGEQAIVGIIFFGTAS